MGGSTDGGFKSSTKQLMLLVDLTPGPDLQLEKKVKLDLEMWDTAGSDGGKVRQRD